MFHARFLLTGVDQLAAAADAAAVQIVATRQIHFDAVHTLPLRRSSDEFLGR